MPRHRTLFLEEAITLYLDDCRVQNWKPSTITGYARSLRCFLRWGQSHHVTHLTNFTAETVKQYIAHVQRQPKWAENPHVPTQQRLVSPTTVRNYVCDLKAFDEAIETHQVNSPADKHYAQRQQQVRRLPFGRRPVPST